MSYMVRNSEDRFAHDVDQVKNWDTSLFVFSTKNHNQIIINEMKSFDILN